MFRCSGGRTALFLATGFPTGLQTAFFLQAVEQVYFRFGKPIQTTQFWKNGFLFCHVYQQNHQTQEFSWPFAGSFNYTIAIQEGTVGPFKAQIYNPKWTKGENVVKKPGEVGTRGDTRGESQESRQEHRKRTRVAKLDGRCTKSQKS